MKKPLSALFLAAAVVSGVGACGTPPVVSSVVDGSASTPAAHASSDSTTLMVRGTIGRYDGSTRVLSLSTSSGTVQFPVPSAARIRLDGHAVATSELGNLHGYPAAVRYSESSGTKTVESVHVLERTKE
jgi:hypothetical protein